MSPAVLRPVTRLFAAVMLAGAVCTTVATVAPTAAFADSTASMESQFVAKMNGAREAAGLRPYAVASDLTSVARAHSAQMASRQTLYHNPDLTTDVKNWQAVGENVGEGPTVSDIHNAFMQSPEHRANILDHDFTQVGVGVSVDNNGIIWVTEDFREPMKSTSSTSSPSHSSHSTTSHSTTSRPATQTTHAAVATTTRSTAATAPRPTRQTVARAHVARAHPTPSASPQAQLLARLTAIRTAAAQTPSPDPVAAAFDYLSTVTDLTTA